MQAAAKNLEESRKEKLNSLKKQESTGNTTFTESFSHSLRKGLMNSNSSVADQVQRNKFYSLKE
jgi:HSP90 family molecular chaperone